MTSSIFFLKKNIVKKSNTKKIMETKFLLNTNNKPPVLSIKSNTMVLSKILFLILPNIKTNSFSCQLIFQAILCLS